MTDILLLLATAVALCLYLPQLLHTYRSRDVSSFHKGTILLRVVANLLYAWYAALESVYILLGTSIMIMTFEAVLLVMCLAYASRITTTACHACGRRTTTMPVLPNHVRQHWGKRGGSHAHRDQLMLRNNLVKRVCINAAAAATTAGKGREGESLRVLDLASGNGGDLHKWMRCGVPVEYVGVESASSRVEEARRRAAALPGLNARFECSDVLDYLLRRPGEDDYDIISLQFGLNYLVSDREALADLMQSLARRLRDGGRIIMSVISDRAAVAEMMTEVDVASPYFSLVPLEGQSVPQGETGFMYAFSMHGCVDGCIESLVRLQDIRDACAALGLSCADRPFQEFGSDDHPDFATISLHPMQRRACALYSSLTIAMATTPTRRKRSRGDAGLDEVVDEVE